MDWNINGTVRKMRVFLDSECLLSGEGWEQGFLRALRNSTVVVLVLSRGAFANVANLTPHATCDNYLLEHSLALHMNQVKGTHIFPLLVGDKRTHDGEEYFTHYFQSGCHPVCPDIFVEEIDEKKRQFVRGLEVSFAAAKPKESKSYKLSPN